MRIRIEYWGKVGEHEPVMKKEIGAQILLNSLSLNLPSYMRHSLQLQTTMFKAVGVTELASA